MPRAVFDLVALTPVQRAEALSAGNKYYTWLNLCRPKREVTDAEAIEYYVATEFQKKGAAMFTQEGGGPLGSRKE